MNVFLNKKRSVFIDSCAWNFLFDNKINLSDEFLGFDIDLAMTKEVYSFEVPNIPAKYKDLKEYINTQITMSNIREDSFFGFSSYNDPQDYKSRVGGFGKGRFCSIEESEQIKKYEILNAKLRPTGLLNNEADASLAVRSTTGSFVITAESPDNNGPLKKARLNGGWIIYLNEFDKNKLSFRNFMLDKMESLVELQKDV